MRSIFYTRTKKGWLMVLPNTKRRSKWDHIWSWFAGMRNMWDMQGYIKNWPKSLWEVNDTLQTECKDNILLKAQQGLHTIEWPRLTGEILESSWLSILFPLNIFKQILNYHQISTTHFIIYTWLDFLVSPAIYLTHSWVQWNRWIHAFPKGIGKKMNAID